MGFGGCEWSPIPSEGGVRGLKQVDFFDFKLSCVDLQELLSSVQEWSFSDDRRTLYYANAHVINCVYENDELLQAVRSADLVYADGIGVVWAGNFLTGCQLEKMTGADWIYPFCKMAEEIGIRIFILAGKTGTAGKAKDNLWKQYPNLKIVGTAYGFISSGSEAELIRTINEAQPHVLFVGMGTPRQELWIHRYRESLDIPVCWTVGALFDYVAGEERRVPVWMKSIGLEWLWRLLVDPIGKWHRYLVGNPKFISRVLKKRFFK